MIEICEPSEEGERLLALQRGGALPPFKEVLPVLMRIEVRSSFPTRAPNAPKVLSTERCH